MIYLQRLFAAATIIPNMKLAAPAVCGLLALEGVLLLPIGRASGFLPRPTPPSCDFSLAKRTAGAFIIPALLEESLWRAMLLPHPAVDGVLPFRAAILPQCLLLGGLHLLLHPIAGRTVWKRGRDIFDDKRFLVLATIVIAASSAAYVATGSLWAAAIVHWLPVVGWREVYGGEELMTGRRRLRSEGNASEDAVTAQADHHGDNAGEPVGTLQSLDSDSDGDRSAVTATVERKGT